MAERKPEKPIQDQTEDEELKAIYAKMREEFTAADLQKYTEIEEGIPAEVVLAELEAIQRGENVEETASSPCAANGRPEAPGCTASASQNSERAQEPSSDEDPELRAIYEKVRREFTAADLQKYTEIEDGVPVEQVIEEMEAIHREITEQKGM
jgi:hypothetical protein